MKIGELARLNNVTIDTIRHYISIGLLIPHKNGSQYDFSPREAENLQYIQKLKSMRFHLKEIEDIMNLRRTSNWVEPETMKQYIHMLQEKSGELAAEQVAIKGAEELVAKELREFEGAGKPSRESQGVPIRALPYLVCPHCKKQLEVRNATFAYKYLYEGKLACSCGYQASIEKGILVTGNRYTAIYDSPDVKRELYQTLTSDFLKCYQLAADQIQKDLGERELTGKVILENFVNGYFYLYTHLHELPKDALYIIIDKYPETISMYKKLISALNLDRDILYIADASMNYPLAEHCVDVNVAFFSCIESDFYFKSNYFESMEPYMKPDALITGVDLDMDDQAKSRKLFMQKYPEGSPDKLKIPLEREVLKKLGYTVTDRVIGSVWETKNRFSFACHLPKEEMRIVYFKAERDAGTEYSS